MVSLISSQTFYPTTPKITFPETGDPRDAWRWHVTLSTAAHMHYQAYANTGINTTIYNNRLNMPFKFFFFFFLLFFRRHLATPGGVPTHTVGANKLDYGRLPESLSLMGIPVIFLLPFRC